MADDDPIVEQIALAIKDAAEDVSGVSSVVRPIRRNTYRINSTTVILEQDEPEAGGLLEGNASIVRWVQPFRLHMFVIQSDESTNALDRILNERRSLMEKALMADPQWGGLAENTELRPPELYVDDKSGNAAVTVIIAVSYRVDEDDPYTAR